MEITGWQVSNTIFKYFDGLSKAYKKEASKNFAYLLNDMAFSYRGRAPQTLKSRYTIRAPIFVAQNFFVTKKASQSESINEMSAVVSSNKIAQLYPTKFSGWTEELGGEQSKSVFYTKVARNGSYDNIVNKKYVFRNGDNSFAPIVEGTPLGNLPRKRMIKAFISNAQKARGLDYDFTKKGEEKRKTVSYLENGKKRRKTALLSGSEYAMMTAPLFFMNTATGTKALWKFTGDSVYGGKIEVVKMYKRPKQIRHWDWAEETLRWVSKYYTEDVIVQEYVMPILTQMRGEF